MTPYERKTAAKRGQNRRYRERHPLLETWRSMRRRCEKPNARGYKYYGGKGIKVCDEWRSFPAFEAWIMANLGPRPDGCTLDRLDGWGNYEPGNVRWATDAEQRASRTPPWWEWPEFAEQRNAAPAEESEQEPCTECGGYFLHMLTCPEYV